MLLTFGTLVQLFALCGSIFSTSTSDTSDSSLEYLTSSEEILSDTDTEYGPILVGDNVLKSRLDYREYRHLTLPNGLECLLISDDRSLEAAVSLDINVGSTSDPRGIEGLAHFLEHLLFMGTEKYPDEAEYDNFLNTHGGYSNAHTAAEHTNFHYEIPSEYLQQSLDIFSQFFISPLFLESCVERELNAIDSEYMNYFNNDYRRITEVTKHLSSSKHPYHHFFIGNFESLGVTPQEHGIDIRSALIDFYKMHYSANLMRLAVYGNYSLDNLQSIVVSRFVKSLTIIINLLSDEIVLWVRSILER